MSCRVVVVIKILQNIGIKCEDVCVCVCERVCVCVCVRACVHACVLVNKNIIISVEILSNLTYFPSPGESSRYIYFVN